MKVRVMTTISRRVLLKSGGSFALAALGSWGPSFLRSAALAAATPATKGKILVVVFQRGAADGLSMVAPYGDPHYYKLRNVQADTNMRQAIAGAGATTPAKI